VILFSIVGKIVVSEKIVENRWAMKSRKQRGRKSIS